jgi:hypothetical protein
VFGATPKSIAVLRVPGTQRSTNVGTHSGRRSVTTGTGSPYITRTRVMYCANVGTNVGTNALTEAHTCRSFFACKGADLFKMTSSPSPTPHPTTPPPTHPPPTHFLLLSTTVTGPPFTLLWFVVFPLQYYRTCRHSFHFTVFRLHFKIVRRLPPTLCFVLFTLHRTCRQFP